MIMKRSRRLRCTCAGVVPPATLRYLLSPLYFPRFRRAVRTLCLFALSNKKLFTESALLKVVLFMQALFLIVRRDQVESIMIRVWIEPSRGCEFSLEIWKCLLGDIFFSCIHACRIPHLLATDME